MEEQILTLIDHLTRAFLDQKNGEINDVHSALGEVQLKGIDLQVQISLISNKKLWLDENAVGYSEVVKIHK